MDLTDRNEMLAVEGKSYAGMPPVNVGFKERIASIGAGALLFFTSLGKKSLGGALLFLSAVYLLFRGISGHCPAYQQLGVDTTRRAEAPRDTAEEPGPEITNDEVLESSWESFPTSDAPSWTMGRREDET